MGNFYIAEVTSVWAVSHRRCDWLRRTCRRRWL